MTAIPSPTLILADDFAAQSYSAPTELEKGRLKVLPMPGAIHGYVSLTIGAILREFVRANHLGYVLGTDTYILIGTNPDTVRGADALFVSYQKVPRGQLPVGILRVAPELVVEVKSPSDEWAAVFVKVQEYLHIGVRLVVVLDPERQTASIYQTRDPVQRVLSLDDTLTLPEVLPGFSVPVRELFE